MAIEDSMILDAFSVQSSDESIQEFLKIIPTNENSDVFTAQAISLEEANIPKHLLEKITARIEIKE